VVWKAWKSGVGFELIQSDKLSGGISAWRKEVFDFVHFDVRNGFHMFEDIDFSTRVARHYGGGLYINPNVRLAHYCSPINRDFMGVRQKRKLIECFLYYKKRKNWSYATTSFIWVLLGMFLEAIFQSILSYSLNPLEGYFQGIREGFSKKLVSSVYE
jgi:GT2 family glycosyltransferase